MGKSDLLVIPGIAAIACMSTCNSPVDLWRAGVGGSSRLRYCRAGSEEATMRTQDIEYKADGATMIGQYVVDDSKNGRRPGVLIIHEGSGLTEHTKKIAARLAQLGYAAFAMDYFGGGEPLPSLADARLRITAWIADPSGSRARALAALDVLKTQKEVDTTKLAAIGYCFGGTTALEIGRSGVDVKAIVGFHSGLVTARPQDAKNIKGKVLVC